MNTVNPTLIDYQSYSILIIDDNPTNLRVAVDYLEDHGFEIMVARNGQMGIKRARYAQPDLILLDVRMPNIDGFETCRRLKANTTTNNIPVIFMTALTSTEDKVKGFAVGAVDYVTNQYSTRRCWLASQPISRFAISRNNCNKQTTNSKKQIINWRNESLIGLIAYK